MFGTASSMNSAISSGEPFFGSDPGLPFVLVVDIQLALRGNTLVKGDPALTLPDFLLY
jgi:hypothetical protein